MKSTPNSLKYENSLYLQSHSKNPVNWFSWNEESLNKAKKEKKTYYTKYRILFMSLVSCNGKRVIYG